MIIPLLMIIRKNISSHVIPMERFYDLHHISRQGFSQAVIRLDEEQKMMSRIKDLVKSYRLKNDRRAGSRSLYYNLKIRILFGLGVNKFERLMSSYKMTLAPLRMKVVTTKSCYQSWNYPNLCNGLKINGINQLVVGDLTYLAIGRNRYYLFCLTDVFSARVVGYEVSTRMRKEEAQAAMNRWITVRGRKKLKQCIHHTDGGTQYFSKKYLKEIDKIEAQISVARSCLENGYAEQKNGVIKNHLIPTTDCDTEQGLRKAMDRIIYIYNHERKQSGLGWKSPVEFERMIKEVKSPPELILHDHKNRIPSKRMGFRRHETAKNGKEERAPKKV